jgi:hypothetical protein
LHLFRQRSHTNLERPLLNQIEQLDLAGEPILIVAPSETTQITMRSTFSLPVAVAAIWLFAFSTVNAHTWVEKIYRIASNGTFVDPAGYPRNFIPRTSGFDETAALNQIPVPFTGQSLMCKGTKGVQPAGYPSLGAAPKDVVALTYEENGHVTGFTTKAGKPAGRGTVFVYGTTQSLPTDTYLGIHRVWNTEGTGGDKRGKLIAVQPFDDGRCFQAQGNGPSKGQTTHDAERQAAINFPPGTELPCQTDVTLPADIGTSGTYSLYWVWEWPTLYSNGAIQTNESYTSCIDITLTSQPVAPAGNFIAAQVSGTSALSAGVSSRMATPILINPSALPQVTADDPNSAPVPANVPAPTQIPTQVPTQAPAAATSKAAASPAAASPAASPAATNSANANQGGKMVTVTVTEQQISTMTVTEVVPIVSSIASHPSSPSSSVVIVTGKPVVTPFLAPTKRAVTMRGRPVMV